MFQLNFNWNFNLFIDKNAFENLVCEMAANLYPAKYVDKFHGNKSANDIGMIPVTKQIRCCVILL